MKKSIEVIQTKNDLVKENFLLKKKLEEYKECLYYSSEIIKLKDEAIELLKELRPERKHALLFHEKNGQCRVFKMSHG